MLIILYRQKMPMKERKWSKGDYNVKPNIKHLGGKGTDLIVPAYNVFTL